MAIGLKIGPLSSQSRTKFWTTILTFPEDTTGARFKEFTRNFLPNPSSHAELKMCWEKRAIAQHSEMVPIHRKWVNLKWIFLFVPATSYDSCQWYRRCRCRWCSHDEHITSGISCASSYYYTLTNCYGLIWILPLQAPHPNCHPIDTWHSHNKIEFRSKTHRSRDIRDEKKHTRSWHTCHNKGNNDFTSQNHIEVKRKHTIKTNK